MDAEDGVPHSGPMNKRGTRKSARFNVPNRTKSLSEDEREDYVEITLDVHDDSVAVQSVKPFGEGEENPEISLLAKKWERRSTSFGTSVFRSASSRIRQASQELRRIASVTRRGEDVAAPVRRSKSTAIALKGLKFINKADAANGWPGVEKRFDELAVSGRLPRALFGQCIGSYFYSSHYRAKQTIRFLFFSFKPDKIG